MIGPKLTGVETTLLALSVQLADSLVPGVSFIKVADAVAVNESTCTTTGITPAGNPVMTG
jgi:hypothetical protein